jgi:benzoyl-CoA reductase subunit C
VTVSATLARFEQIFDNRHQYAEDWKSNNERQVMGFFCTYAPEEIIHAAGILPVRIFGSHKVQDITDKHIFPLWCPYCRDCLYEGLSGHYDYLDGILNTWCCQHIRGTYISWWRNIKSLSYHHEIYWPVPLHTEPSRIVATKSFARFQGTLEKLIGEPVTPEALQDSIAVFNRTRRLMREVYELRKRPNPPLSGAQAMSMVVASQVMDKQEHSLLVEQVLRELSGTPGPLDPGIRLMIMGSENDDRDLVRFIESMGATVVIDDHCTGTKYIWEDVTVGEDKDLISAITNRYIAKPACPNRDVANPGRRHPAHVLGLARDWDVQGVIFIQEKFCDPHLWDFPVIEKVLKENGLPTLSLEVDVTTPVGQFRTRLEAFLETLESEVA